jgi:hypothetical protein
MTQEIEKEFENYELPQAELPEEPVKKKTGVVTYEMIQERKRLKMSQERKNDTEAFNPDEDARGMGLPV